MNRWCADKIDALPVHLLSAWWTQPTGVTLPEPVRDVEKAPSILLAAGGCQSLVSPSVHLLGYLVWKAGPLYASAAGFIVQEASPKPGDS